MSGKRRVGTRGADGSVSVAVKPVSLAVGVSWLKAGIGRGLLLRDDVGLAAERAEFRYHVLARAFLRGGRLDAPFGREVGEVRGVDVARLHVVEVAAKQLVGSACVGQCRVEAVYAVAI